MRFRAVFFDAGETLVHPVPSFPELFAAVVTREGHPRDPVEIREGLAMVSDAFDRAAREHALWTTSPERSQRFWCEVYDLFLEVLGIPPGKGLVEVLYREFTDLGNYAAFDDARPAMAELHDQGLRLGVVSNFEPWLDDLLARLGLRDLFDVRVISGVEGIEKPDPAIFRLALARAGLRAEEVVYVGDIPDFDVMPAAALGMYPVLIDRRERHQGFDGPGVRITSLAELSDAVGAAS
jgi:putative hydrolase of the HAD superfamily